MKQKKVKVVGGGYVTKYTAETAEDRKTLDEMVKRGEVDPGGGPAFPPRRRARRRRSLA